MRFSRTVEAIRPIKFTIKMKRTILFFQLLIMSCTVIAQEYSTKELRTVAQIWGECYLFHPSVVRADREVNWEKQLVKFLPSIKETSSEEVFLENINSKLLVGLKRSIYGCSILSS